MKFSNKLFALALAFGLCLSANAQHAYESVEGDAMQARIYTLRNGLKIYLSVNKEKPRIQTYIAVRTGSVNDPAETTGLAHYLEHLMFKGTTHFGTSNLEAETPYLDDIERRYEHYRTQTDSVVRRQLYHEIDSVSQLAAQYNIPNEYDKMMAAIGSEGSNAYTSNDVTCYTENIPANEVDNWARVEADRFRNMVIRGFHTELEAVYEEYNIGLAMDGNKLWDAMSAKLYPDHPYGTQTTIGKGEHLKNPSITNIKNYYRQYYQPSNIAICMAGDLDPEQTVQTLEKYFGDWQDESSSSMPSRLPIRELTSVQDTSVLGLEAEQIMLAWRAPQANNLAHDTLEVLARVLYNGTAGLLDLDINQQMKAQGVFAASEGMNEGGALFLGGQPRPGQSLDEVKQLLLDELAKLRSGDFPDDLVPAVVKNLKSRYFKQLRENGFRANQFVDAFINRKEWRDVAGQIDRMERLTKQDIVDYANRHLTEQAYVVVRKLQGEDPNVKKVDKPAITAIPTNNHLQSEFLREVVANEPAPIQPRFVDFGSDIQHATSKSGKEVLYVSDPSEHLFTLQFRYPLGSETEPLYGVAANYLSLVGTKKLSNEQISRQFYALACDYSIRQSSDNLTISLNGLAENMSDALSLLHTVLTEAVGSADTYSQFVDLTEKERQDERTNQRSNFSALHSYATYGEHNPQLSQPSIALLRQTKPETLLDMLAKLNAYDFTTLYYGPATSEELTTQLKAWEKGAPKHLDTPENHRFKLQTTGQSEVFIAPYDAKNIYMQQYLNEGRQWNVENAGLNALFNDYFGGGMNAIVFQELREARGLAYSASARYSEPWREGETESFTTQIITQNDKMADCLRGFRSLLDSVPEREAGFQLAKQGLLKNIASSRTVRFDLLSRYMDARRRGFDFDLNQKIYEQLPAITLPQLMQYARERVSGKQYRFIILGDEKELDMDVLQKLGPIHRLTTEQIFGY